MKVFPKMMVLACTVMLCVVSLAGCGKKYDACTFEGTVTCAGQPVPSTDISLDPPNGDRGGLATTDATGHFAVRYTRDVVGIPPGEYKISISVQKENVSKERDAIPDFQKILKKYSKGNSPLSVTVDKPVKDYKIELSAE